MEHQPEPDRRPPDTPPQRGKYSYPAAGAGATDPPVLPPPPDARHTVRPRGRAAVRGSVLLLAAGGWLLLAPFALDYSAAVAIGSDVTAGFLLAIVAIAALVAPARTRWAAIVAVVVGVWVVVAPFVLFYAARSATPDAIWNDLVVGVIVIVIGVTNALNGRRA